MTTLWLIRHGETDWNIQRRFQGISDQPLNATGRQQAAALAPRLASMTFDAIYASDLARVKETIQLALNDDLRNVQFDARLREISFGMWEGLTWDDIKTQYPDEFAIWVDDRDQNLHGGDKLSDVVRRVEAFLSDIQQRHTEDEQILLIGHGGILGIALALLLEANPMRWWRFLLRNCTLNEVQLFARGAMLTRLNDDRHLPE